MQDIVITYKCMISNARRTKIVKANFILKETASLHENEFHRIMDREL